MASSRPSPHGVPTYAEERSAVQFLKTKQKEHGRSVRTPRDASPAAVGSNPDSYTPIDYQHALELLGQSNHKAMLELFSGSGLPPDASDTAVTVSFEMFSAIQERLMQTRAELEKTKDALMAANQRSAEMQTASVADRERMLSLERKLAQANEYGQHLRQNTAELSMQLQSKEGERKRLDDLLTKTRAEYKLSAEKCLELSNDLVIARASMTRLTAQVENLHIETRELQKRNADMMNDAVAKARAAVMNMSASAGSPMSSSAQAFSLGSTTAGSAAKGAVMAAQLQKLKDDLRELAQERDIEITARKQAEHDARVNRAACRRRLAAMERTTMAAEEDASKLSAMAHQLRQHLIKAQMKATQADQDTEALRQLVSVAKTEANTLEDLFARMQDVKSRVGQAPLPAQQVGRPGAPLYHVLDASRDGVMTMCGAATECIRMASHLEKLCEDSASLSQVLRSWRSDKGKFIEAILQYATVGQESLQAALAEAPKAEMKAALIGKAEAAAEWQAKIAAQYKLRMPEADAGVQAVTTSTDAACGHASDGPLTASFLSGMKSVMTTTAVTRHPKSFNVDAGMWTDVDYKLPDWIGRLPYAPADLQGRPRQLFDDLPKRVVELHRTINLLAAVVKKRMKITLGTSTGTDPVEFLETLNEEPTVVDAWQLIALDDELVKALLAGLVGGKDDAIRRLLLHTKKAEFHSTERTLEVYKGRPPKERGSIGFKERQRLTHFKQTKGAIEQDIRQTVFDDTGLAEAARQELLRSDGMGSAAPSIEFGFDGPTSSISPQADEANADAADAVQLGVIDIAKLLADDRRERKLSLVESMDDAATVDSAMDRRESSSMDIPVVAVESAVDGDETVLAGADTSLKSRNPAGPSPRGSRLPAVKSTLSAQR
jgi:hypothetical protein